jgi:hypothetical protein
LLLLIAAVLLIDAVCVPCSNAGDVVEVVWVVVVVVVVVGVVAGAGADEATAHVRVKSVAAPPTAPSFGDDGVNDTTRILGMLTGLTIREFRPDIAGVTLQDVAPGATPAKFTT